jgi:hypothetical protein
MDQGQIDYQEQCYAPLGEDAISFFSVIHYSHIPPIHRTLTKKQWLVDAVNDNERLSR